MTAEGTLVILLPLLGFMLGVLSLVVRVVDDRLTELNDRLGDLDLRITELASRVDRVVALVAMSTPTGQRGEIDADSGFAEAAGPPCAEQLRGDAEP